MSAYLVSWLLLQNLLICKSIAYIFRSIHHLYFCAIYLPQGRGWREKMDYRVFLEKKKREIKIRTKDTKASCCSQKSQTVIWFLCNMVSISCVTWTSFHHHRLSHWGNHECQWYCCCHCWNDARFPSNNHKFSNYGFTWHSSQTAINTWSLSAPSLNLCATKIMYTVYPS